MVLRFSLVLCLSTLLSAQTAGPTIPKLTDALPEMVQLLAQDQWDRGFDFFGDRKPPSQESIDWNAVNARDQQRREAARKLLAEGKLQTGKDYYYAAFLFQHSLDSAGYLLAHSLAITAVSKGELKARWIAAATMDRYLMSLSDKQPQIFGTQFHQADGVWTQEPFDRATLSDAIRAGFCVASLAEQEQIVKDIRAGKPFRSTQIRDCK
jgi:hypothetical protein